MNSSLTTINIPLVQDILNNTGSDLIQNLRSILGVQSVEAEANNNGIYISYDARFLSLSSLRIGIERAGYTIKSTTLTLNISGMTCGACVNHVETAIRNIPNTLEANVNLATERANIEYVATDSIKSSNFIAAITEAGYSANTPGTYSQEIDRLNKNEELQRIKNRLTVSFLGSMLIFLTSMHFLPWHAITSNVPFLEVYCLVIATVIQFWCGYGFYTSGIRSLIALAPNMNSLIIIGTSVAYGYSVFITILNTPLIDPSISGLFPSYLFFDTSTMIITLILLGKYLETIAMVKTSQSIRQLIQLRPTTATLLRNDHQIEVQINEIEIDDVILIRPGEIVPVDGVILSGFTSIDESILTGESVPQDKGPKSQVYTGTINFDGSITVITTKNTADSMLSQIISLVERAQGSKAPVQILADKISSVFVPSILLLGLLAFLGWGLFGPSPQWIIASTTFISIIIIACPCALGLATPTAIVTSTGKAAQLGILIKDAETLEQLKHIDTIVFDKTGTLTEGELEVLSIESISLPVDNFLKIAASLENYSEHPIAKAIVQHAKSRNIILEDVTEFKNYPGLGVTARKDSKSIVLGNQNLMQSINLDVPELDTIETRVYLSINNEFAGFITLTDKIKQSAPHTIQILKSTGKTIILASGDNDLVVKNIAEQLGISKYYSQTTPEKKYSLITDLQAAGSKVLMIGDGINDAPALTQSNISMAIGQGSDISIEASQITLLRTDLSAIIDSFKLSEITSKIIKQNLFWAFFYNLLLIPIAAGILYPVFGMLNYNASNLSFIFGDNGFLNPVMAAFAMAFSSITVISNSLRIKKINP